MEVTDFLPLLYEIFVQIDFLAIFMVFHKILFVSKKPTKRCGEDPGKRFHIYLVCLKLIFLWEFSLVIMLVKDIFKYYPILPHKLFISIETLNISRK